MRWTEEQYQEYQSKQQVKKSKYKNIKTEIDGIKFDSRKEADYYKSLVLLQRAGIVSKIELQVKYILQEGYRKNGKAIRPIIYIADFRVTYTDGHIEIIDTKGVRTEVYKIKKKLFEKRYPDFTIKEV